MLSLERYSPSKLKKAFEMPLPTYFKSFSGFTFLFILSTFFSCTREADYLEHPNVLFIAVDDLNDWIEPLGGHPQSKTPHLNAFAKEAVNFRNNYCTSPGCNPSRSTLLTGYHTYNSGMYSNYQDWRKVPKLQNAITLGRYFKEQGYYTAGAGKIFHYGQVDTLAWHEYFPSIKSPMPQDSFPEVVPAAMPRFKYIYNMFDWSPLDIPDEQTGDYKSVEYISKQLETPHKEPFFLACGIYRPHLPWYVPQAYFDLFPLDSIQLPELLENDTSDLGDRAKEMISRGGNYHKHVVEAGEWKKAVQGYLASVAYADEMVGTLLNNLKNSAYADNTIVVLWSDHGWQLGEKMHWRKFALWENVIQTALMIKVPEGIKSLPEGSVPGTYTDNITSLIDLYPTLVDLCSLEPRADLDGQSLKSILANPAKDLQRQAISTYDYGDYSIRAGQWHYIRYIDDSEELYHLENDPNEWNNLAQEIAYRPVMDSLMGFLPQNPIPLPESSLIPLMEHHVPPIKSKAFYFSKERTDWLRRFENLN